LEMWEKAALDGAASGVGSKIDVVMCILRWWYVVRPASRCIRWSSMCRTYTSHPWCNTIQHSLFSHLHRTSRMKINHNAQPQLYAGTTTTHAKNHVI
jgi:hypothetical protein